MAPELLSCLRGRDISVGWSLGALVLPLSFSLMLASCEPGEGGEEPTPILDLEPKVLVIGVDGLRGDAPAATNAPNMQGMLREGAGSWFGSTQLSGPTVSGPGWVSILMGVEPQQHGLYDNESWPSLDPSFPSFIARAHGLGYETATAIHWIPIQTSIIEPGVSDHIALGTDEAVTEGMVGFLEDTETDVAFVHLDDCDGAGHGFGFSNAVPEYATAVEVTDGYIGQLLEAIEARPSRAEESWLVMLTSDHGGFGTDHGPLDSDNRTIPVLFYGDPVTGGEFGGSSEIPGELDLGFVSHLDIYPTLFSHLGHEPDSTWRLDGFVRALP